MTFPRNSCTPSWSPPGSNSRTGPANACAISRTRTAFTIPRSSHCWPKPGTKQPWAGDRAQSRVAQTRSIYRGSALAEVRPPWSSVFGCYGGSLLEHGSSHVSRNDRTTRDFHDQDTEGGRVSHLRL